MSFSERTEEQKSVVFNNTQMLESYCQENVTALKQACRVFKGEFMRVGNIDNISRNCYYRNTCNKMLRKLFLKPDTIGLIPTGGYTGNVNYSNKAVMWLVYREQADGCHIRHGTNGREYKLPELRNLRVDGFCSKTKCMNLKVVNGMANRFSHFVTSLRWQATL
jgi:hypothetical protein